MKLKTLLVTVVVLALAAVAVHFASRPRGPRSTDPRVGTPLVDGATVEKAAKIKLSDQGKDVVLVKQPDATWRVATYYDFPADFQKLSSFVGELTSAKIEQLVTSNPDRLKRLEFKNTQIELLDGADKPLVDLTIGKQADAGGKFVRFGAEQRAYRASLNAYLDTDPKSWADAALLTLKPDEIAKIEVDFPADEPVIASRAKKEDSFASANPPAGQRLNDAKITGLISSLGNLRFSDTAEANAPAVTAAKEHERTVKFTTFDGKTVSVSLGRKPEQKTIEPPAASTGASGPAALGSVADLGKAKKDGKEAAQPDGAKLGQPATKTIPAGPVYAFIDRSDLPADLKAIRAKRAFEVYEYAFTTLPEKRSDLFEPIPPAKSESAQKPSASPSAAAPAASAPAANANPPTAPAPAKP